MLDASSFVSDAFNLIIAPCGSGKTTAAINTIAALASSPRKALFLIDTQNGNLRLTNNKAEDLSIKKLTKNAPSVKAMFDELNKDS